MSDFVTPKYRQSTYCEVAEGFNGAYVNFDEVVILKLDHQSFRLEPLYDDDADEPEKDRMLLFQADQVNIALRRIHEKAVAERDALKAENERLRGALERIITQWDTPNWKLKEHTGVIINEARKALKGGAE